MHTSFRSDSKGLRPYGRWGPVVAIETDRVGVLRPLLWRLARRPNVRIGSGLAIAAAAIFGVALWPAAAQAAGDSAERREVPERRTESSQTFVASTGEHVTRSFSAPVHYRSTTTGGWEPIDNTLVRSEVAGYEYENRANRYRVLFPERLEHAPIKLSMGGAWLSFSLAGSSGRVVSRENQASIDDALPGVSLTYTADGDVVKEAITLMREGAPTTLTFRLQASDGLVPQLLTGGRIAFGDGAERRFELEAPFMYSQADPSDVSSAVDYAIRRDGEGWELTVRADPEWVADRIRRGPVVIDPPVRIASSRECGFIKRTDSADSTLCASADFEIENTGDLVRRPMLRFDVSSIPGNARVIDAEMGLYMVIGQGGGGVALHRLTRGWTANADWHRYDGAGFWTTAGGDFEATAAASATRPASGGWMRWYPVSLVAAWVAGTSPNHGLIGLGAASLSRTTFRRGGSAQPPYLDVTYHLPPANRVAPVLTGEPRDGRTLSTTDGEWDGTPPFAYQYQWERCPSGSSTCQPIHGATSRSYAATSNDVGMELRAVVTATNAVGSGSAASARTAPVAANPPSNGTRPTVVGTAQQGQTLNASEGVWGGSDPKSYAFQWLRCAVDGGSCSAITGATARSYTLASEDVGRTIRVRVTASNAGGSATAESEPTSPILPGPPPADAQPPRNDAPPTISGSARDGETLTASTGSWSGTPPIAFQYQWRRCDATTGISCADIDGARASSYALTAADVGHRVAVVVTANNAFGTAMAGSAPVGPVQSAPPVNRVAPGIAGVPMEDQELVAHEGIWTGTPELAYLMTWLRCDAAGGACTAVATGRTYVVRSADVDHTLRLTVTAANSGGSAAATSPATARVIGTAKRPTNTAPPTIAGTPRDGETLSASNGTWSGTQPMSFRHQWLRCSDGCTEIGGATGPSYQLTPADVGYTVAVAVTALNVGGSGRAQSSTTAVVQAAPPSNVAPPVITGAAIDGERLVAREGTWRGTPPLAYGFQWLRCGQSGDSCAAIAGASERNYYATADDVGRTLRVRVAATNAAGSQEASSAATAAVQPRSQAQDLPLDATDAAEAAYEEGEYAAQNAYGDAVGDSLEEESEAAAQATAPADDAFGAAMEQAPQATAAAPREFYEGAARWAREHWSRPDYDAPGRPYGPIQFTTEGDDQGVDCTNFTSHAWNLGGRLPRDFANDSTTRGWFVRLSGGNTLRSVPWVNVRKFFIYWVSRREVARWARRSPRRRNPAFSIGDVIQIDHGGGLGYSHASLVTSIEGVDKVAQWSRDLGPTTRWNEFFYERTRPRQRADVRVRVIHYTG
jgi:hypothetical protein